MEDLKTIYVDIDETICYHGSPDNKKRKGPVNYSDAKPFLDRIDKINKLYDQGKIIVYWTARGSSTGKKWFHVTYNQLNEWGCKYHELKMGKPSYDLFIDDKNINSEEFFLN